MKVTVSFKEINSDFNQEYADTTNNGEESEDNIKCTWEDELNVTEEVESVKIFNRETYYLRGSIDGVGFEYEIPDMTIFQCNTKKGETIQFAVSRKLVKETDKKTNLSTGNINFIFYLKDKEPAHNPVPGVYIADKYFPTELKN